MTTKTSADIVMQRCDMLGAYSEEPDRLTRPFATPAMHKVNELVTQWMHNAGMSIQQDAVGNLIGRYEARSSNAKTLLLGSHLDSVRDAGKYDGPLGVMIALACVERLHACSVRLPFAIEVLGFADEEGLRYRSAYIGSRVAAGTFNPADLHLLDDDGISMADAIRIFGGNPDLATQQRARWRPDELLGYCEVHIEQGPILEAQNLPVGIVSAIAGQKRISVHFTGEAGHAGTVPMSLRHDALCAAAELILAVETLTHNNPGLVATVGQINVQPNVSNVIPGQVMLSLDVRHQDDTVLEQVCQQLEAQVQQIASARHVSSRWQILLEQAAMPCSPRIKEKLAQVITEMGYPLLSIPSGAGHDAATLSNLTDIGMLFVRCRGGISHNPAEAVTTEDVAIAIAVLERFLMLLTEER